MKTQLKFVITATIYLLFCFNIVLLSNEIEGIAMAKVISILIFVAEQNQFVISSGGMEIIDCSAMDKLFPQGKDQTTYMGILESKNRTLEDIRFVKINKCDFISTNDLLTSRGKAIYESMPSKNICASFHGFFTDMSELNSKK